MDENLSRLLSTVSVILMVIGALSLFFMLYRGGTGTIALVNRSLSDRGAVYQAESDDSGDEQVTGAHIIGTIQNGLETTIIVDSVVIPCTVDPGSFDYQFIDSAALYSEEILMNTSGEVSGILYRKK